MQEQIVETFHQKMSDERINNHSNNEHELKRLYREILFNMADDFSTYRKIGPGLLSSLESNNLHSVSYSIILFFDLYNQIIKTGKFKFFDLSLMEYKADNNTVDQMALIFKESFSKNNRQRLSEENFNISMLSDEEKKKMGALIINKLQDDSLQLNWNKDLIDTTIMSLAFLRQILVSIGNSELFYHVMGLLLDRLSSSEFNQAGRDLAEELIVSSYKDELPELGYFNSFRMYSNIGSIHAALVYANLSFISILKKEPPYSEKIIKEIVFQGMKFFRNVRLYPWVEKIYTEIPAELNYTDYERRSIDHTYFVNLLMVMKSDLPLTLLNYLQKERENIIASGANDALPWLLTLYNVKRLYPTADFSLTGLGFFIYTFEMMIEPDVIKKYKDIIEANSSDLKRHLKESLIKLAQTRNTTDFFYDNKNAIMISSRLIDYSAKHNDTSGYLLSMRLKSDYSILFKQQPSQELAPLELPEIDVENYESIYEDKDAFLNLLPASRDTSVNWLAFSEGQLYQLELFNGEFSFPQLYEWNYKEYQDLSNSNFFVNLTFDDTIKDKNGVREVMPEEFLEEEKATVKKLKFSKLYVSNHAKEFYLVKDMEFSRFPHNLLLDAEENFIAKQIPVTNILSTEWLTQTNRISVLPEKYTKAIWIPTETGDYPLNYLHSNIEDTLEQFSFETCNKSVLPAPLSSDLNIICSHGAKNISETQVIFQNNNPTYDLNAVIGSGKILIFFVCYSGSMKTEFFRNNVSSLIKRFIAQGYESVIAPSWALDVRIPKYWLPEFLNSVDAGLTISKAVFNANKRVSEKYPTASAWACLHLYGNPLLKRKL